MGTVYKNYAMEITLLRMVDSKMQSRCLDSYALAYLFIIPYRNFIDNLCANRLSQWIMDYYFQVFALRGISSTAYSLSERMVY